MSSGDSGRVVAMRAGWNLAGVGRPAVSALSAAVLLGLGFGLAGCYHEPPGPQRPSVDTLDPRDRGLQSLDINQAADRMAASLLSDPGLNASHSRWTLVVGHMEDLTHDRTAVTDY